MAKNKHFLKTRLGLVLVGLASLVAMWLLGLRATDTGSWWQYSGVLILFIFGLNRLIAAVHNQ